MNDNLRQFVFGLLLLAPAAAAEELLPKFLGTGFPVLLAAVQALAARGSRLPVALALAAAGGALEDAISSLPLLAGTSYFVLVAALIRLVRLPRLSGMVTYPCFQLWLAVWMVGANGGIFARLLLSVPLGGLTAAAVCALAEWANGKGAVDECD